MRSVVKTTQTRRDLLCHRLSDLGYDIPGSTTNFVLIRLGRELSATQADNTLKSNGLILRRMRGYGLADSLRATVGSEPAMSRLGDILES